MAKRLPAQKGRLGGVRWLAFLCGSLLCWVAVYRVFNVAPPPDPAIPEVEATEPPEVAPPTVPPPPPPAAPALQRKRVRPIPPPQIVETIEEPAKSETLAEVRVYNLPFDDNSGSGDAIGSSDAANPAETAETGPVFVVPPTRTKEPSRALRWVKSVGKVLHISPQKDPEEQAFRADQP